MLAMTQSAVNAIKHIAPGGAGLRVFASGRDPEIDSLQIEIAEQPQSRDRVLEAGGAQVFLEPQAAETLDDMVLDATHDERGVRFAITRRLQQPCDPGEHDG